MKKFTLLMLAISFLAACQNYTLEVDLTPEKQAELEQLIETSEQAIAQLPEDDISNRYFYYLDIADAYRDLGEAGKAIETYNYMLEVGLKGEAGLNNLGRIYEEVGEGEKAVEIYQRLIDEYQQKKYLYDILWVYLNEGDLENAQKYYSEWKIAFERPDSKTEQALRKLKEEAK